MDQTFVRVPSDVERPASEGVITRRTLDTNSVQNQKALNFLQAIVDKDYATDLEFDDLPEIGREDIVALLSQLIIRFDTKPDYYTKKDYQLLIGVLTGALTYLYNNSGSESDIAELLEIINELKIDVNNNKIDIIKINNQINQFKLWVENNYVPEEGFEERVNELIEAALPDIPQPLPQKQITYTEGSGIDISASDSDTRVVSAVLTEPITVSNVSIGGYSNGMVIQEDTPIVDILKTILQKVVDVIVVKPSVKLTGDNYEAEYGSSATKTATLTLTQGKFESADSSQWQSSQNMNCKLSSIDDDWAWTISANKMSATSSNTYYATSKQTFKVPSVTISANTITPKKSDGNDSNVTYTNTELTPSGSITVTPYYNIYFGPIASSDIKTITSNDVRSLPNKIKALFPLSNQTSSGSYKGEGQSILIACPSEYELNAITSDVGLDLLNNFTQTTTLNVKCGGNAEVSYRLYLYSITNGADQAYKNLTFKLVE